MKVITLVNQKGGCGKSTVVINLALSLALAKHRVILLDTDPQRSSFDTIKVRKHPLIHVIATYTNLYQTLEKCKLLYEYVIIDTPPHIEEVVSTAILCSDIAIIPVQDSPLDIRSTKTTVDLIRKAKRLNPKLKAYFLLSRIQPRTVLAKELSEVLQQRYNINILKSYISNRVAYKHSLIYGKTVSEFSNKDPAASEIASLVNEIESLLHKVGE
jgi:chromosome partitioning protein